MGIGGIEIGISQPSVMEIRIFPNNSWVYHSHKDDWIRGLP